MREAVSRFEKEISSTVAELCRTSAADRKLNLSEVPIDGAGYT